MSTDKQYYYAVGERVHGPVPAESLVAMYQSRHLADTTMICPVGGENWVSMSELLQGPPYQLVTPSKQDTKPLESPTTRKKQDGSSRALNMLAVFCFLPCAVIILLSLFNPKAFIDLWGIAILSIMVALFFAVLAKLVAGKS
jgi:hypothetical protein